jgi:hypothetical protein
MRINIVNQVMRTITRIVMRILIRVGTAVTIIRARLRSARF